MESHDSNDLQKKVDDYFRKQFLSILNDFDAIDKGVESIGTCQINNQPVLLSEFKEAFDEKGNFKEQLPENYALSDYQRIGDEITQHKLDKLGLSDKIKLMLSGAIFDAQEKLYNNFASLMEEYTQGVVSDENIEKMQNMQQLINGAPSRVIEKLGAEEIKKLADHLSVEYSQENLDKLQKAKNNLIDTLNLYISDRGAQSDSLFGYGKDEKKDAANSLINFLKDNTTDVSQHIGALTQGKLGTLLKNWVKDNKEYASVLPKNFYNKPESSKDLARNIQSTGRFGR